MARSTKELPYAASKLKAPTKCPGGKWYLCRRLLALCPENTTRFVDLYGGSGVITLNAPRRWIRHYNDTDPDKYTVMSCMQDAELFAQVRTMLGTCSYSEKTFNYWLARTPLNTVECAVKEIILRRMSRGGSKTSFAWSERLRGGQPGDKNAWENFLVEMPSIHEGMLGTIVTCLPALTTIQPYLDDKEAVAYADPPYCHDTRVTVDLYDEYEMTIEQHEEMANTFNNASCRIILSGYRNDHYDTWFKDWNRVDIEIANHQSQSKVKKRKIESVWKNYR